MDRNWRDVSAQSHFGDEETEAQREVTCDLMSAFKKEVYITAESRPRKVPIHQKCYVICYCYCFKLE